MVLILRVCLLGWPDGLDLFVPFELICLHYANQLAFHFHSHSAGRLLYFAGSDECVLCNDPLTGSLLPLSAFRVSLSSAPLGPGACQGLDILICIERQTSSRHDETAIAFQHVCLKLLALSFGISICHDQLSLSVELTSLTLNQIA